jgi:hypothetical protein
VWGLSGFVPKHCVFSPTEQARTTMEVRRFWLKKRMIEFSIRDSIRLLQSSLLISLSNQASNASALLYHTTIRSGEPWDISATVKRYKVTS